MYWCWAGCDRAVLDVAADEGTVYIEDDGVVASDEDADGW